MSLARAAVHSLGEYLRFLEERSRGLGVSLPMRQPRQVQERLVDPSVVTQLRGKGQGLAERCLRSLVLTASEGKTSDLAEHAGTANIVSAFARGGQALLVE